MFPYIDPTQNQGKNDESNKQNHELSAASFNSIGLFGVTLVSKHFACSLHLEFFRSSIALAEPLGVATFDGQL